MRQSTEQVLRAGGLDPARVRRVIEDALTEDLGPELLDVTSVATIPAGQVDTADLVARADGVVAGLAVAAAVFELVAEVAAAPAGTPDAAPAGGAGGASAGGAGGASGGAGVPRTVEVSVLAADGERVARGDVLATVTGPTRLLLTAERTALNLLCRMSGVATHTRAWADELAGTKAMVLDTRKTTPGLRALEKYAVRAGGGTNKRMGLHDVAMIKDNHKLAAGGLTAAYRRVRETFPQVPVQVEVTTVAEAVEAVEAGADFLLCDNMTPATLTEVVAAVGDRAELEATGGLTLEVAAEYAATGVDYLSVGALTHSSPILDIAMDLRR
ncbi:nicotinate-nucleotide pyrophosphorylase [Micromonospora rosaria]|uniref:Nicotinate-nucleotide pyrophosphorylase [carboxylating] n=1 Tax=Micromonospora rosaria TaxID=47874 RepID=A0A136PM03_9ACTN|nr:carboxylating nicotinate-nucleotide diphosphorylase [Micromonospora rosaria]KXK59469.1 nicotinate-nucleotide pyrophosphorylase [Micromonospora rosaria]